jgi:hypothetical protein
MPLLQWFIGLQGGVKLNKFALLVEQTFALTEEVIFRCIYVVHCVSEQHVNSPVKALHSDLMTFTEELENLVD